MAARGVPAREVMVNGLRALVAERAVIDGKVSYACPAPECFETRHVLDDVVRHAHKAHGVAVVGPRAGAEASRALDSMLPPYDVIVRSNALKVGEKVVIGAAPPPRPVTVAVSNGTAVREIEMHNVHMSDVFETVQKALEDLAVRSRR